MYLSAEPLIIGADECGYGCIAGPLIVCAVACQAKDLQWIMCKDSKKYGHRSYKADGYRIHKDLYTTRMNRDIRDSPKIFYSIVEVSPTDLCRWGYTNSLGYAYRLAIATLRYSLRPRFPSAVLDGIETHSVPYASAVPKADASCPVVSLASCLGKQRQIKRMQELHQQFPSYGFLKHHGYGTPQHAERLKQLGMVVGVHRIPIIVKMKGMQNVKVVRPTLKESK